MAFTRTIDQLESTKAALLVHTENSYSNSLQGMSMVAHGILHSAHPDQRHETKNLRKWYRILGLEQVTIKQNLAAFRTNVLLLPVSTFNGRTFIWTSTSIPPFEAPHSHGIGRTAKGDRPARQSKQS
jgi:hypothetical protein